MKNFDAIFPATHPNIYVLSLFISHQRCLRGYLVATVIVPVPEQYIQINRAFASMPRASTMATSANTEFMLLLQICTAVTTIFKHINIYYNQLQKDLELKLTST